MSTMSVPKKPESLLKRLIGEREPLTRSRAAEGALLVVASVLLALAILGGCTWIAVSWT